MSDGWTPVSKRNPCAVCGHTSWCGTADNGRVVHCMRVESNRPCVGGGWIHFMWERPLPVRRPFPPKRTTPRPQLIDMERVMQGFRAEFEAPGGARDIFDSLTEISADLNMRAVDIDRLLVGRSKFYKAWCFAMRDGDGKVVGVRLREYVSGRKWSVAGSKDGLFYDPDMAAAETVSHGVRGREIVVCEGATDCAAGYSIGLATVGRSSCNTGVDHLKRLCERLHVNRVTIVTDNDRFKQRITFAPGGAPMRTVWRPGIEGAERLAHDLGRMYRLVTPPKKDLREWLYAGLTAETFRTVADAQKWRMPK